MAAIGIFNILSEVLKGLNNDDSSKKNKIRYNFENVQNEDKKYENNNFNNNSNNNYNNNNNINYININKEEEDNKKDFYPQNEDEENKQIEWAIKQSEEEAKLMLEKEKEEEKQLQLALEESEKECNKYLNINNINEINDFDNINSNDINSINYNNINEKKEEEEFDENFGICVITQEYMENPVITPSGNYYEKSAIIDWINREGTEPMTREKLTVDMLVEDDEYRRKIIEYRKKFNK